MARLLAVCRSDDHKLDRRQLPLVIDDTLTMIAQFTEKCSDCKHLSDAKKKRELDRFVQKYNLLSKDEVAIALMVTNKTLMNQLAHTVSCVGCRRSVEHLFNQLVESQHPSLEPLSVTQHAELSLKHEYLFDPKAVYALFYIHGTNINDVMDSIPVNKKNKRCNLHSLETHKSKTSVSSWVDTWELLSTECREEVVLIDSDNLLDTLNTYLRKHRFCSECKTKVHAAFNILIGELDSSKEKGYCPALYEGLRYCSQEAHIHVLCDTDFIAHLITKAEPEIAGSNRRDRHAKTMDIAQEEVLTCLGIHIYERLHRISQKLRAEEQTWQILFSLGVECLQKSFEVALECKQGVSNLELVCEEFLEEERAKEEKKLQKRQKRKKKKGKTHYVVEKENRRIDDNNHCQFSSGPIKPLVTSHSHRCENHGCSSENFSSYPPSLSQTHETCEDSRTISENLCQKIQYRLSDCGYSSGADNCDNCSMPSSHDGSVIICSDGVCTHEAGECSESLTDSLDSFNNVDLSVNSISPCQTSSHQCHTNESECSRSQLSLLDMLEDCCTVEEDGQGISEEEIQQFKADHTSMMRKRLELRETLRKRFHDMKERSSYD
ncbi:hypothetical protein SNE40_002442 [Patella caerulea]|uniref:Gametogenetin-binding protein 2 n=1 Tax=Patella caerulea TaxID=87958 RepID=A0AAN8PSH2_PATCE